MRHAADFKFRLSAQEASQQPALVTLKLCFHMDAHRFALYELARPSDATAQLLKLVQWTAFDFVLRDHQRERKGAGNLPEIDGH